MAYLDFLYIFGIFRIIFGLGTHRGNQPLSWFSQFNFWLWRCYSHLVHIVKFQLDVQGGILITTLDLSVFPNIATTTILNFHICELTKCELFLTCEIFLPERLPSEATIINRQWCYNCWEIHVHHNICITKLWDQGSYFLYLYMVFLQHCFHS